MTAASPNRLVRARKAARIVAVRRVNRPRYFVTIEGVDGEVEVRPSRLKSPRRFVQECARQTGHEFEPSDDSDWLSELARWDVDL